MNACPKCGGINGFEHIVVIAYTYGGSWGEESETTGHERRVSNFPKVVSCVDCNARIPVDQAMGLDQS